MATQKPEAPLTLPRPGEVTKPQSKTGVFGMISGTPGFTKPPPGTFATYRLMRRNPTIAVARMAATAPIRAAKWSFEADDDAPDEALDVIETAMKSTMRLLTRESVRALDYGFQAFEIVWDMPDRWLVPRKLKPLLPDLTQALVDKETGAFAGIKQQKVELEPSKSFWFPYDAEGGDFYGRARNENVRDVWSQWNQTLQKAGKYGNKIAGVVPMVRYPIGQSEDASGATVDNFDIAQRILENLGRSNGVAWPTALAPWADDMLRAGVDVEKLLAWQISFLETRGRHGRDFADMLRQLDSYLVRGWLQPERSILEGVHGTKAEAGEHADVALMASQEVLNDIALCINWYLIDKILVLNWGPEAAGTVRAIPAPIVDEQARLVRTIVEKLLTQPATLDVLFDLISLEAMVDQVGLPRRERPAEPDPDDIDPALELDAMYRRALAVGGS